MGVSPLALCVLTTACSDPTASPAKPAIEIAIDSSAGPLVRVVMVQLDARVAIDVTYGAPGTPVLTLSSDSAATTHRVLLPRLRAEREYSLEVRAGGSTRRTAFTTGVLPPHIRGIQLEATGTPSLPVALVEVVGAPEFTGLLIIEDAQIVGYLPVNGSLFGMTRRSNGEIILLDPVLGLVSRRLDAAIVHRLPQPDSAPGAPYGRIHHDVTATPHNTVLFIANETRLIDGVAVLGEALWEWVPETGAVLKRWSAFDHLDWHTERGPRSVAGNWLHGNGISYGPRGNVIMSLRNVDQVISIAPDFATVEWKVGGVNGTVTLPDEDRFYGQHQATEHALNRVLVYDNGFGRPGGAFTRVVEYEITPGATSATKVWEYRHQPDIYAALVGSARRLPNGNTTVLFGMTAGENLSSGPLTAVEVDALGVVRWRLSFGPQLTRLYRIGAVGSLVGERVGSFQ